jgi:hypothetical protein
MKANYRSTMLTVKKLRRKPKHFHNFTGLTPEQFDQLLLALEPLYEEAQEERLENPNLARLPLRSRHL